MTSLKSKRAILPAIGVALVVAIVAEVKLARTAAASRPINAEPVPVEQPAEVVESRSLTVGCWEVSGTDGSELRAVWVANCPDATAPELGAGTWPVSTFRLPAREPGEPSVRQAVTQARMSPDLAVTGQGAMLYLPISDQSGYYVAGWSLKTAHSERAEDGTVDKVTVSRRGTVLGLYGAPPTSVATPHGRVYLSEEFSPHRFAREGHAAGLDDEDPTDEN